MRFGSFSGGKDAEISQGQEFQCDCPKDGCPCGRWGHWIPAGRPVPNVVLCDQCTRGDHSG